MKNYQVKTPIAFIIFNRPEVTERVFAEIAHARPAKLLVVGDGARVNQENDVSMVALTREIINRVNWPCELLTNFSEVNLGCRKRVSSGLDWVFSQVEEAIILEDDCLPDPSFFYFCDTLLARYRDDPRIMTICGTNLANTKDITESYYFAPIPHIWGWATWKRVWDEYDVNMPLLDFLNSDRAFNSNLDTSELNYWLNFFNQVKKGVIDTWDVQLTYLAMTSYRLSIFPRLNLIKNIGFGADATHTKRQNHLAELETFSVDDPLIHPKFIIPLLSAASERNKKEGIGTPRIIRAIKFLLTGYGIRYSLGRLKAYIAP